MKYFSMFSGIGGFEYGIQQAIRIIRPFKQSETKGLIEYNNTENKFKQWKCVGYSEIDKYAIQIYKRHFGGHKNYGNAKDIKPEQLPDFDLLVGGFPCQAFSIAGKRGGFEDTRGTLFFEIARVLKEKQPRMFLLENVKGLLNHNGGNTFTTILQTIDELGYDAEWEVLNSKHFGVPQNRERVFIIGHLRGTSSRQVFPLGQSSKQFNEGNAETQVAASLQHPGHSGGNYKGMNMIYEKLGKVYSNGDVSQAHRVYDSKGAVTSQRGGTRTLIRPVLTPDRPEKRQNGRRFKEDGEPMFTLTGQDKHGVLMDSKIRRLTPIECERLQGFPDGWTAEGVERAGHPIDISDSQRYKCLGNAVTTNVITAIMEKIFTLENKEEE